MFQTHIHPHPRWMYRLSLPQLENSWKTPHISPNSCILWKHSQITGQRYKWPQIVIAPSGMSHTCFPISSHHLPSAVLARHHSASVLAQSDFCHGRSLVQAGLSFLSTSLWTYLSEDIRRIHRIASQSLHRHKLTQAPLVTAAALHQRHA